MGEDAGFVVAHATEKTRRRVGKVRVIDGDDTVQAMRRKLVAACAIAVVLACTRAERSANDESVRDVVLVTIDTLRADAPGYAGNKSIRTPALDALASRGIVYTNAHAHNVVTLASHANILTGLYPYQHGIRDNAGFTLNASTPTIASVLHDAGFATAAFVGAFPLDSRFGLTHGFDVYDDHFKQSGDPLGFDVAERPGGETVTLASKWWSDHAQSRRFLWVHLYEPHAPYTPPTPYDGEYRDRPYYGEVAAADHFLSLLIDPILQSDPKTLVIVTGDHGESLGEHGEDTHGLFAYESTLAVPLIVADPRMPHSVDKRLVRHIDIAPTIAARAGVKAPREWPGVSLLAAGARPHSYFEALSATLTRGWAPLTGVIDDGHKLIELPLPELYDLRNDPHETSNAFASDRRSVARLRSLLAAGAPVSTQHPVSNEEKQKLLSLGYLAGTSSNKKSFTAADDPKNLVSLDREMHAAVAAYQQGDIDLAIQRARHLISVRPDMQLAQEMLAFFLKQNAKPEEAIAVLEERVRRGDAPDSLRVRLGLLLSEAGRARDAVEVLRPLAGGNDVVVLNAYGIALADSGDARGAVEVFQRVLAQEPANAQAFQNMGIVALRARELGTARQYLERAVSIEPRLPLALNALGVVEAESGNDDAAIARWSKCVDIDPKQLDALFNLGLVAARAHRNDVAKKALTDYLDRARGDKFAAQRARAREILAGLG
jgi:arylsulfatase A-like enzyme/Flp pilus assembly protein TadD